MMDMILLRLGPASLDRRTARRERTAGMANSEPVINGIRQLAVDTVAVLETLTGREDLRLLTMPRMEGRPKRAGRAFQPTKA
jgi:hypothetical protein